MKLAMREETERNRREPQTSLEGLVSLHSCYPCSFPFLAFINCSPKRSQMMRSNSGMSMSTHPLSLRLVSASSFF